MTVFFVYNTFQYVMLADDFIRFEQQDLTFLKVFRQLFLHFREVSC